MELDATAAPGRQVACVRGPPDRLREGLSAVGDQLESPTNMFIAECFMYWYISLIDIYIYISSYIHIHQIVLFDMCGVETLLYTDI